MSFPKSQSEKIGALGETRHSLNPSNVAKQTQQIQQQSGFDAVRARCAKLPLAIPNHHLAKNEKTPRFPENTEEKAGFSGERLRSELNRRWRICNPLP